MAAMSNSADLAANEKVPCSRRARPLKMSDFRPDSEAICTPAGRLLASPLVGHVLAGSLASFA